MRKLKLPSEREGRATKFSVAGFQGYVIVNEIPVCEHWAECPSCADPEVCTRFDPVLAPVEVFVKTGKEGSTLSGLCRVIGKLISVSLRHGVPVSALVKTLRGEAFEPSGWGVVGEEKPVMLASLSDVIAKILERYA